MQRPRIIWIGGGIDAFAAAMRGRPFVVAPSATLALLVLVCSVAIVGRAAAAPIAWGAATTIAGDSDVITTGSSVFAYNWANTNQTVNGQAFVGTGSGAPPGLTFSTMNFTNTTTFTSESAPFADLSAAYKSILTGGIYNSSAVTVTAALTDLTQGRSYAVQVWVGDPRGLNVPRSETLGGFGGNTVSLAFPLTTAGQLGQYSVGLFAADAATQSFTITPNNASTTPQVNALQLRDVTNLGAWTGINGATWDASTTANFASNLFSAALSNTTADVAQAPLGSVVFGDAYWNSSSPTTVTQTSVTIAAGGVSANTVRFANSSLNYTLTSSDSIGLTGSSMLMKGAAGTLTLAGTNSYTGGTYIAGGVLAISDTTALPGWNVAGRLAVSSGGALAVGNLVDDAAVATLLSTGSNFQAGAAIGFDTTAGDRTYSTAIANTAQGALGLVKTGSGTLSLSTASTYTGTTTVAAGTLNTVSLGAGALTVNSGAKLSWTSAAAANLSPATILLDGGTLSLDGTNTFHNRIGMPIELRAGTLTAANGAFLMLNGANSVLTVAGSGLSTISMQLQPANGGSFNVGDTVSGPGTDLLVSSAVTNGQNGQGIIKNGAGTMELSSGSNTYNGPTQINAGTVALSGAGNIATSSGVNLAASGTAFSISAASGNRTIAGLTGVAGSAVELGANTLTVSNATSNTFSGSIGGTTGALIKQGTGTLGVTGAMTLNNLFVSSGTLLLDGGSYTTTNPAGGNGLIINSSTGSTLQLRNNATVSVAQGLQIQQGLLDIDSGSITIAGGSEPTLYLGNSANTAALTMTGGTVTTTNFELGNGGATSTLNLEGGTLQLGANPVKRTGAAALNMGGGTLRAGAAITIPSGLPFNLSGVNGDFTLDTQSFAVTAANAISGSGGMIKTGTGTLTLSAANTYSGASTVTAGTLLVNGSLANTSAVTVAAGGVLGGSGSLAATLAGAGLVSPGNSPGILTAPQVDPSAGTGYAFEFTGTGSPAYGSPTASINDVLRLTDTTTPFTTSLTGTNVIDVYFDVTTLGNGDTFRGGFYTDNGSDFLESIEDATYAYWVRGNGSGADRSFNGQGYYSLASFDSGLSVTLSTVPETANFGSGDVNGQVTQFVVVPEPGTLALASLGLAAAIRACRRGARWP
jgi:fibronectin-binding autotransporter adhesin